MAHETTEKEKSSSSEKWGSLHGMGSRQEVH